MARQDMFNTRVNLAHGGKSMAIYSLKRLEEQGLANISRMPFSLRVLLENLLRHCDGQLVQKDDVLALAQWNPKATKAREIPFMPARVVLQDFTGVPCVVDLAAMRSAVQRMGGDPKRVNPLIPVDLVIDHSVQVDLFGSSEAFLENVKYEYERNHERYTLLRWAQKAFSNFRVVPPGTGIVHQVNLEYLASVVQLREQDGVLTAFPDTLVGTDSHTTMINGLGVLGWGVGGIEAEAVMLGQPYGMLIPEVVGFRLTGKLPEGATATDLVLTVTQMLRKRGVVDKFVEFLGPGLSSLGLADRATLANMAPEYGATMGFFPVDDETLRYLRLTGRSEELIALVERYCKEQGLFRTDDTVDPEYNDLLELDMGTVEPSMAGPRRPQDRVRLGAVKSNFIETMETVFKKPFTPATGGGAKDSGGGGVAVAVRPQTEVTDGAVVIAAITSCTNTSNPSVMMGAALLAKKAVERGLEAKPWVKTSLAPGSRVVSDYLEASGLMPYLEALRFHIVGYGCTTCIGNSGALPDAVARQVQEQDLVVAAVLSGNRNFEGRINPLVKANYLASPPLVVAYAIAGRIDIDLETEPLGHDRDGKPVYLKDIWPSQAEVKEAIAQALKPEMFQDRYSHVFEGDELWQNLPVPEGEFYEWDERSTYIQEPPYFFAMPVEPPALKDIRGARLLAVLGDSITTDHISPAGAIPRKSPTADYLMANGVEYRDFNTYGARRGNHEVMMRGTFGNIRLRNQLAPGTEGGWTKYLPTGEVMSIYEAAMKYKEDGTPLLVIAGKEYGTGSSRDWAAKGTFLLGVRAVIAESYERIHRSNLIGMGVLPLQFMPGDSAESLGLHGDEEYEVLGIDKLAPGKELEVRVRSANGNTRSFKVRARVDSQAEMEYLRHEGILQYVLRNMMQGKV